MMQKLLRNSHRLHHIRWQSTIRQARPLPYPYNVTLNQVQQDELSTKFSDVGDWTDVGVKHLMAASLHLGHAPHQVNEFNLGYIYGERAGVHVINLEETLTHLRRAANVVKEVSLRGGSVLFVGTRPRIHHTMVEAARRSGHFFCIDWKQGLLTNRAKILSRSAKAEPRPTRDNFVGINLEPLVHLPTVIVAFDLPNTPHLLIEAQQLSIPTIALIDTNVDPREVTYPIPANDDTHRGVELVAWVLSEAARQGLIQRSQQAKQYQTYQGVDNTETDSA